MAELADWLFEQARPDRVWLIKRLSANDVGATKSHQSGIYIAKHMAKVGFPGLLEGGENPKRQCELVLHSHDWSGEPICTWYNQGSRNEVRLTKWGRAHVVVRDHDQVGALLVLSVHVGTRKPVQIDAWLARDVEEEDAMESVFGDVEPGDGRVFHPHAGFSPIEDSCVLSASDIRARWGTTFPSTQQLVDLAISRRPGPNLTHDRRLVTRRDCEEAAFYSVERVHTLQQIKAGFSTVDEFINCASRVLNRRKSRAGRSLELHLKKIFDEAGLSPSHNAVTEGSKRPDFVFPNIEAYRDRRFPVASLRVLGVKTTLKDRWRQVLNEAGRMKTIHLFTLQQGVSIAQFEEMREAGVRLVVPAPLRRNYPVSIRPQLTTLAAFCEDAARLRRA